MVSLSHRPSMIQSLILVACRHQSKTCTFSGFRSGFWSRGVKMRRNVLLGGGKLYYIPESKAYDKLGET